MKALKTVTMAELRVTLMPYLASLPDDCVITWGNGDLTFAQPRDVRPQGTRGQLVNLQFVETYTITGEP